MRFCAYKTFCVKEACQIKETLTYVRKTSDSSIFVKASMIRHYTQALYEIIKKQRANKL